ncbi:carotenoid biosynthesis protein [Paenibacillus xanthanilyticus]|uniref:Carotenoid biosynthesis protein n=1 Tax=Paenibacillus xanthanilyticus TaxID=1783531 RepID=A0ABV8K700_9BACL
MSMLRPVFLVWYAVGLALMLTVGVPSALSFSNGCFLVFFTAYALSIEAKLEKRPRAMYGRALAVGVVTFAIERIGVVTGFPFGGYAYTSVLGVRLAGVPLTIALAWVGILTIAVLLASSSTRLGRAVETGCWTVLLDLVLDPVAYARQFWLWREGAGMTFHGVPLQNFAAWFLIAAIASLLYPLRPVPTDIRREAARLMQLMLLMFGLLALREDLLAAFAIALAGIAGLEGAFRHAARNEQRLV